MYIEVKKKSNGKYDVTPDVTPTANIDANTQIPFIYFATSDYPEPDEWSYLWLAIKSDGSFCTRANASEATYWLKWGVYGGSYRDCYVIGTTSYPWAIGQAQVNEFLNCTVDINGNDITIYDENGDPAYDGEGTMTDVTMSIGTMCIRGVAT